MEHASGFAVYCSRLHLANTPSPREYSPGSRRHSPWTADRQRKKNKCHPSGECGNSSPCPSSLERIPETGEHHNKRLESREKHRTDLAGLFGNMKLEGSLLGSAAAEAVVATRCHSWPAPHDLGHQNSFDWMFNQHGVLFHSWSTANHAPPVSPVPESGTDVSCNTVSSTDEDSTASLTSKTKTRLPLAWTAETPCEKTSFADDPCQNRAAGLSRCSLALPLFNKFAEDSYDDVCTPTCSSAISTVTQCRSALLFQTDVAAQRRTSEELCEYNDQLKQAAISGDQLALEDIWNEMCSKLVAPDQQSLYHTLRCLRKAEAHPIDAEQLTMEMCKAGSMEPDESVYGLLADIRLRYEQLAF